jgi:hypothetical protein
MAEPDETDAEAAPEELNPREVRLMTALKLARELPLRRLGDRARGIGRQSRC